MRLRLLALMAAVVVVLVSSSAAGEATDETAALVVRARALRQGEVLHVSWTGAPAPGVSIRLFGTAWPAYERGPSSGAALVGVDLDQAPGLYALTLEDATGQVLARTDVAIAAGEFTTRTLRVDPAFVNPPRAALPRIQKESALLQEVFARVSDITWTLPVTRPVPHKANSRFGQRSVFNGEPRGSHGGTDFLSPAGTPIRAPLAGRVVVARNLYFAGGSVIIDHGNGMFSQLAHMSKILAVEGSDVAAGDVVGHVGATGRVTGAHLHWALRINGARVDPLSLAEAGKQIAGGR